MSESEAIVSVVIPTLNEARHLGRCLRLLNEANGKKEIIVVDGGSADNTLDVAGSFPGVQIMTSAPGRGLQMNFGVSKAKGRILWFLHADSRVPKDGVTAVEEAVSAGAVGGAFRFALDGDGLGFRIIEWGTRIRSEFFGLPYGDQGIFVRREVFNDSGGFKNVPMLEDLQFVREIRREGDFPVVKEQIRTSPRRYKKHGVVKTTSSHVLILLLNLCGAKPESLAKLFRARN